MKKQSFFLLLAVFGLFLSCKKDEEESVSPYFFSCKIAGKDYAISNTTGTYALVYSSTRNDIYDTEVGVVTTPSPRTMYITIESTKVVGVHTLDGKNSIYFEDADKSLYRTNFNGGSGKIEITSKTATEIKGKFSGIANTFTTPMKTVAITDGQFTGKFK